MVKQDKWGYPRRWKFWVDPIFWMATLLMAVTFLYSTSRMFAIATLSTVTLMQVFWPMMGVFWIGMYWYIYDSYRWEIPDRWLWFIGIYFLFIAALPYYLFKRRDYLEEIEKRRNLPY